ncbi:MAG: glycosyltransferase family 87 protein [Sphingobium sp.]
MIRRLPDDGIWPAGALLFCLAGLLLLSFPSGPSDFDIFYRAAAQFHSGNLRAVYEWRSGNNPFRYIPFSLLMLEPFAWLPLAHARMLWFGLQYICLMAALLLFHRALRIFDPRATWICLLCVLCSFRGWIDACMSGQSTGIMLLAASAGLYAALRGRHIAMGAWTGFATAIKVVPGIFFFPTLLESPRAFMRVTIGCLGLVMVATAILAARVGTEETRKLHHEWVDTVVADDEYVKVGHVNDQSLKGVLVRVIRAIERREGRTAAPDMRIGSGGRVPTPGGAKTAWMLSVLLLGGGFVLACAVRRPGSPLGITCAFGVAACLFLVLNPTSFGYVLPFLIFPIGGLLAARPGWRPLDWGSDPLLWMTLSVLFVVYGLSGGELSFLNIHGRIVEKLALPLLANLLLTGWLAVLAYRNSMPRLARSASPETA